jgi:hypothetical protein
MLAIPSPAPPPPIILSRTRHEYIRVGSSAASLPLEVRKRVIGGRGAAWCTPPVGASHASDRACGVGDAALRAVTGVLQTIGGMDADD